MNTSHVRWIHDRLPSEVLTCSDSGGVWFMYVCKDGNQTISRRVREKDSNVKQLNWNAPLFQSTCFSLVNQQSSTSSSLTKSFLNSNIFQDSRSLSSSNSDTMKWSFRSKWRRRLREPGPVRPGSVCLFRTRFCLSLQDQVLFVSSGPGSVCLFRTRFCLCLQDQVLFVSSGPGSVCDFRTRFCLCLQDQVLFVSSGPGSVCLFRTRICLSLQDQVLFVSSGPGSVCLFRTLQWSDFHNKTTASASDTWDLSTSAFYQTHFCVKPHVCFLHKTRWDKKAAEKWFTVLHWKLIHYFCSNVLVPIDLKEKTPGDKQVIYHSAVNSACDAPSEHNSDAAAERWKSHRTQRKVKVHHC